jgi:hypothetical protein
MKTKFHLALTALALLALSTAHAQGTEFFRLKQ